VPLVLALLAVDAPGKGNLLTPDDSDTGRTDEYEQQHFGDDRIAQAQRRVDGGVEAHPHAVADDAVIEEVMNDAGHAFVDGPLRNDQQRQCDKQARAARRRAGTAS